MEREGRRRRLTLTVGVYDDFHGGKGKLSQEFQRLPFRLLRTESEDLFRDLASDNDDVAEEEDGSGLELLVGVCYRHLSLSKELPSGLHQVVGPFDAGLDVHDPLQLLRGPLGFVDVLHHRFDLRQGSRDWPVVGVILLGVAQQVSEEQWILANSLHGSDQEAEQIEPTRLGMERHFIHERSEGLVVLLAFLQNS